MGIEKSNRTFSKRMLVINMIATWGAIFYAIFTTQAAAVVASGFGLVLSLYGLYTGIGHLDLKAMIASVAKSGDQTNWTPNDQPSADNLPEPPR